MKIDKDMDLDTLAKWLGGPAYRDEAITMRTLLIQSGYADTQVVPIKTWYKFIGEIMFIHERA